MASTPSRAEIAPIVEPLEPSLWGLYAVPISSPPIGSRAMRAEIDDATESEVGERAALELESTFESRLAIWEHMARHGSPRRPASRRTVAVGVAWT